MTANDPQRARRSSQAEQDIFQRFSPDHFVVNEKTGQIELRIIQTGTLETVSLEFVSHYDEAQALGPVTRHTDSAGNLYASAIASMTPNTIVGGEGTDLELIFSVWPLPVNLDRTLPLALDVGAVNMGTSDNVVQLDLSVWVWQPGEDLTREADLIIPGVLTEMRPDLDMRMPYTIPEALVSGDEQKTLKLRMERQSNADTTGETTGLGVHELLLTYSTLEAHTHGRV
jgi:hypothetical protein